MKEMNGYNLIEDVRNDDQNIVILIMSSIENKEKIEKYNIYSIFEKDLELLNTSLEKISHVQLSF